MNMPVSFHFAAVVSLLVVSHPQLTQSGNGMTIQNNRILDKFGREVYFHGVNVVFKGPPYLPITSRFDANLSFSEQDMQLLRDLGQNVIRLGVMWPGVAPQRGMFDQEYLSKAKNIIDTAYKYGIYTLVDCHQDVLTEAFCGEGAPNWAMSPRAWDFPFPVSLKPYPFVNKTTHMPSRKDCLSKSWASYYPSGAVGSSFEAIYQNKNGLRDDFGDYFHMMAKTFADSPGVIGYELLNEPWAGDIERDPLLLYPGEADRRNLQPFYDAVAPRVWAADPDTLVFFESVTWTDDFNSSLFDAGFTHAPGGSSNANRSVYSFHYYNPPNSKSKPGYFDQRIDDAKRWGTGTFLTEFGISNDGETVSGFDDMSDTMGEADAHLTSWIGWEYKPLAGAIDETCTGCGNGVFHTNGTQNKMTMKALSRTYATAVAGRTVSMKFDYHTGNFDLKYEISGNKSLATTLYVNQKMWYPNGFKLVSDPAGAVSFRELPPHTYVALAGANTQPNALVTVSVQPNA